VVFWVSDEMKVGSMNLDAHKVFNWINWT